MTDAQCPKCAAAMLRIEREFVNPMTGSREPDEVAQCSVNPSHRVPKWKFPEGTKDRYRVR
ncbi:hypothetical protein [Allobranchiibius huperziae]|uniref:Uncharacterized protein n=1 Tax=Allobranchiibius huperziae TaxID=1874116 RepID=A0A853DH22_9MICO|nr:hypothetical protein [Allobranchiibius huperziae]NYJ76078.1 hypothetical protein [Allobranchiibius huperziae]